MNGEKTNLAPRNEYHDSRDTYGLPAYQQFLDLGFAPTADLITLSSFGGGSKHNYCFIYRFP